MHTFSKFVAVAAIAVSGTTVATVAGPATPAMACDASSSWTAAHERFARSLPALHSGSYGIEVVALQAALKVKANVDLSGTGNFAAKTKAAVVKWQQQHGLEASGVVGYKTWVSLTRGSKFAVPINIPNPQLSPGAIAQENAFRVFDGLSRIGYIFDLGPAYTSPHAGQPYRADAVSAVQVFQEKTNLDPSGIIGAKTAHAIDVVVAMSVTWSC